MTGPLPPLQVDLATVVARLEQIDHEGWLTSGGVVAERLLTCDLPRLRTHLTPEALALINEVTQ